MRKQHENPIVINTSALFTALIVAFILFGARAVVVAVVEKERLYTYGCMERVEQEIEQLRLDIGFLSSEIESSSSLINVCDRIDKMQNPIQKLAEDDTERLFRTGQPVAKFVNFWAQHGGH